MACRRCETPVHPDCWIYTGVCPVYGCRSRERIGAFPGVPPDSANAAPADRSHGQGTSAASEVLAFVRFGLIGFLRFAVMLGLTLTLQLQIWLPIWTRREPSLWPVGIFVTSIAYAFGYSYWFAVPEVSTKEGECPAVGWFLGFLGVLVEVSVVGAASAVCVPIGTLGLACMLNGGIPDGDWAAEICAAPYRLGHRLAWG